MTSLKFVVSTLVLENFRNKVLRQPLERSQFCASIKASTTRFLSESSNEGSYADGRGATAPLGVPRVVARGVTWRHMAWQKFKKFYQIYLLERRSTSTYFWLMIDLKNVNHKQHY
ncbi:MAG: hypothetical protein C4323_23965 [Mastigocladus sp. ERB_26_2]